MPLVVYVIEGWFGDHEWVEGIYANKDDADEACKELWMTRTSKHPLKPADYATGLHKFDVVEHPLIGGTE